jgi:hypothetical protein
MEIPTQAERGSGISLKPFTFIPESRSRSTGFRHNSKRLFAAAPRPR